MNWPVEIDPVYGCHVWTGKLDKDGYAVLWRGNRAYRAYVVAWEAEHGPIADGFVVDHGCRNRRCVGITHLELVTKSENEKRKHWKWRAKRKECKRGHDLGVNGIVTPHGGRVCRACRDDEQRNRSEVDAVRAANERAQPR